jgi:hypothetical protein
MGSLMMYVMGLAAVRLLLPAPWAAGRAEPAGKLGKPVAASPICLPGILIERRVGKSGGKAAHVMGHEANAAGGLRANAAENGKL